MKNLHKHLRKNNAISLICYDIIPSNVWQVFTKWRNEQGIKVNVVQFMLMKRRVYQIEFTGNISLLEADLRKIDPRFLKKLSWLKRMVKQVKRQKNLWMPWVKTKYSNMKDDIEDLFCYYVKSPIIRIFKRTG